MEHNLVLDTTVLLENPAILSSSIASHLLWIPECVIDEISRRSESPQFRLLAPILSQAAAKGIFRSLPRSRIYAHEAAGMGKLSVTDLRVLNAALSLSEQIGGQGGTKVIIATNDRTLAAAASDSGLTSITGKQLQATLQDGEKDSALEEATLDYQRAVRLAWGKGIFVGAFLVFLAGIIALNLQFLLDHFEVATFVTIGLFGGPIMFWIRCRMRLSYGIAEVGVGLIGFFMIYGVPQSSGYMSASAYQLAGSIYIVVRGMDNIDKAIESWSAARLWNRFFKGNPKGP